MWSKRLMRTVMAGMAVLVWSTSVAAQECSRPPAKVAVLGPQPFFSPTQAEVFLFCDKAKAPSCTVTFWCSGSSTSPSVADEDPVTWDVSVEPGRVYKYGRAGLTYDSQSRRWIQGPPPPGSFYGAVTSAGWSEQYAQMSGKACVVRSNDPVEVYARYQYGSTTRRVSQRISPPEPYPCLSSNAALSGLTVSGGGTLSPSFDSDTTEYTFTTRATTVTFTPTAADSGATISVNNGAVQSGTTSGSFAVPWTRLPITVTAEDGTTTRTYYVSTTRFGT